MQRSIVCFLRDDTWRDTRRRGGSRERQAVGINTQLSPFLKKTILSRNIYTEVPFLTRPRHLLNQKAFFFHYWNNHQLFEEETFENLEELLGWLKGTFAVFNDSYKEYGSPALKLILFIEFPLSQVFPQDPREKLVLRATPEEYAGWRELINHPNLNFYPFLTVHAWKLSCKDEHSHVSAQIRFPGIETTLNEVAICADLSGWHSSPDLCL